MTRQEIIRAIQQGRFKVDFSCYVKHAKIADDETVIRHKVSNDKDWDLIAEYPMIPEMLELHLLLEKTPTYSDEFFNIKKEMRKLTLARRGHIWNYQAEPQVYVNGYEVHVPEDDFTDETFIITCRLSSGTVVTYEAFDRGEANLLFNKLSSRENVSDVKMMMETVTRKVIRI